MPNPVGSIIFGTTEVRTDEYILLMKIGKDNGSSIEEADLDARFIDDCLQMLKVRSIHNSQRRTSKGFLRKNSDFSKMIESRLDILLEDIKELKNEC